MGVMRKFVVATMATALMVSSATPALADWGGGFGGGSYSGNSWGGGGYGGGYRGHHDHGIDAGDVIAGIAIIGVIAAIASAASKSSNNRRTSSDGYPDRSSDQSRGSINSENAAVDACAQAAETRGGQSASVREISAVDKNSDGWDVEGVVEQRAGWRDRTGDKHRFTCSVRYGAVDSVYIDTDKIALN
ncbi:MAG: hypothetical protein RLZZ366_1697 [Pseudomonadota bacterium]|jgi:hypothetical protein